MESKAFEHEQKLAYQTKAKQILDEWVRYESAIREKEQRRIAEEVIANVMKSVQDPRFVREPVHWLGGGRGGWSEFSNVRVARQVLGAMSRRSGACGRKAVIITHHAKDHKYAVKQTRKSFQNECIVQGCGQVVASMYARQLGQEWWRLVHWCKQDRW